MKEKKTILVVEDNRDVRENICEILELSGYHVLSADNGKSGVEQTLATMPDLILCDVMMPVLDGFGLLKILQNNPLVNHIPLIFLTAKTDKTDIRKGMGLGADDYLTKPFDDTDLLEAIETRFMKIDRLRKGAGGDKDERQFFSESRALEKLKGIAQDSELRHYKQKDEVYRISQSALWLYYVEEGQIRQSQVNEYGKELTVRLVGPGNFFGYHALILNVSHMNSAVALKDSHIRLVPKEDFRRLLFNDRDFSAYFISLLSSQASTQEEHLLELAYSTVRMKVANALCVFASQEEETQDGITLSVPREELAAIAGTAKETLIRTLSDFKSEGVISVDAQGIHISDIEHLRTIIH